MTFTCYSFLEFAILRAKSIDEMLSLSNQREENSIPFIWNIWGYHSSQYFILLLLLLYLLKNQITVFLQFYWILKRHFTEYFTWVHACRLIEMAPVAGVSERTFKRMRAWSNYLHLFLNSPFSRLMNQSRTERITVFSQNKKTLILYLSVKSL
jgi:hypothetical protein